MYNVGPPSDANVGLYTPLKLVRYLRIINHSESGVINKLSYPGGQKHCMIPSRNIAIVSTSDFHIVGLKVPKMRSWRFFYGDAAIGCITHIPDVNHGAGISTYKTGSFLG